MAFARRFGLFALVAGALAFALPVGAAECPQTSISDDVRTLVAKNAPPWDSLRIWVRDPLPSAEAAEAEVKRIGGSILLLEFDRDDIRKQLLETLRSDTRRVLLDARIGWAKPPAVRGHVVEVQIREAENVQRALSLLAEEVASPTETPAASRVEVSDLGNSLVRLTPTEAEIAARIEAQQLTALSVLERRVNQMGLSGASVRSAGFGRIRAVVPGLLDPARLVTSIDMLARLDVRLVDASIDPCEAASWNVPPDSEIIYREGRNGPVVVKKQPLLESTDIVEVAVALAPPADEPTVVVRLTASAGQRLAKATQAHVGGSFAVVLDQRPIAIVRIAQPLGGWLQMSGGLGLNDAEDLSVLLRAGFLPARLTVIEERVVAPPSK